MLSKNQIKEIQSLQLKKFRESKQRFVVEGIKTVTEVIENAPVMLEELFATRDFIEKYLPTLRRLNLKYTETTEQELKKISLQSTPSGVLAVCQYFKEPKVAFNFEENFAFFSTM